MHRMGQTCQMEQRQTSNWQLSLLAQAGMRTSCLCPVIGTPDLKAKLLPVCCVQNLVELSLFSVHL